MWLWVIQFSSVAQSCPTLCDPMDCSMPGFPLHHQLLELTQTQVHPVGDAIQPSHPLLTSSLPAFIFPSIRVFSSESVLHVRWPKYWSFQLQHQSFQWIFRTDFLEDGLVGSPCSSRDSQESSPTPQFKSISSSGLSFLYSPTLTLIHDYWKTIALIRKTFVVKVMSLLLNMLSRFVIAFLPRSKCLLISWLQSPSAVILEPKKIKSVTVSIVS